MGCRPRGSLLALHAFLTAHLGPLAIRRTTLERLCGEDAPWTDPAAATDPSQSIGGGEEARQLRMLADDLWTLPQTETPHLTLRPGFWEAQLHARTATGLLRYHAVIADPAPDRIARMLRLRGRMMADNLSAIAGREEGCGPTLVFAHNVHLQRNLSTLNMRGTTLEWWSAGAHMHARLGHRYALIAGHLGTPPQKAQTPDTLGSVLTTLPSEVTLVASPAPAQDGVLFLKDAPT